MLPLKFDITRHVSSRPVPDAHRIGRVHLLALLLPVLLFLLCGCARQEGTHSALWVVTEESAADGMNQMTRVLIGQFEDTHPGVSVTLDILPTDPMERELALKRLRTRIMAGEGPDVFLLPSCNARRYYSRSWNAFENLTLRYQYEPLFADPVQSMHSGIFLDISSFYDRDDALEKEALQTAVMDAGTWNGARYLVPLRYDIPVLYVNTEAAENMGLDLSRLDGSISDLMDTALSSGDMLIASGAEPDFCRTGSGFSAFGSVIDYETETVTLTSERLAEFLRSYQALLALAAGNHDCRSTPSLTHYTTNGTGSSNFDTGVFRGFPRTSPITVNTLSVAPIAAAIAQVEGSEFAMLPLRSDQGLAANITYYGAIGAGCRQSQIAYEFLRMFLLEESQWELDRPMQKGTSKKNKDLRFQYHPVEDGWPVRAKGAVVPLWESIRPSLREFSAGNGASRVRLLLGVHLTEENIPLLDVPIDVVNFGNRAEQALGEILRGLNDDSTGQPISADIDALAEQIIQALQWQLLEG